MFENGCGNECVWWISITDISVVLKFVVSLASLNS